MKTKKIKAEPEVKKASANTEKLNDKQGLFVSEYQVDWNATQAAIRAGYSKKTAYSIGQRLLKHVEVAKAIKKAKEDREKRLEVTAERISEELAKIGYSNVKDFVKFDADGVVTITDSEDLTPDQAACIAEVVQSETDKGCNFKFKLHDKLKALELMGKHKKMFTDKVEHSGNFTVVMRDYSKQGEKG